MTFEDFIAKWVCTDNWDMIEYQGSITFSGINAIFTFPPKESDWNKQIYAVSLVEFKGEHLELSLTNIDESLTKYYGLIDEEIK